jgi:probable HAF family extracellular repeat protein
MSALRLALLAGLALVPAARAQVIYTVTEIPNLPIPSASNSEVVAINNSGQVAGYTRSSDTAVPTRAFRWSPTAGMLNLGTLPGGGATSAADINDAGQVVGSALLSSLASRAFRYTDGVGMVDLGTLPNHTNSVAIGINNAGQVTGSFRDSANQVPFRYVDGVGMQNLGLPPSATAATGTAINASGQVAANGLVAGVQRAFRYTDGSGWLNLGTVSGSLTNDMNDAGQVVGLTSNRGYLYTDGVGLRDLGVLPGGNSSEARSINNLGQVVGHSTTVPDGALHAILYSDGVLRDLNGLISPQSGWVLVSATDISDSGLIIGLGTRSGRNANFLLTPVPEPSVLALGTVGAGALWFLRRRRLRRLPPTNG